MKKKILAILIACMMMICCFSACDLTSTDSEKDMSQSVAEVDISQSQDFADDGIYKEYKDVISPMSVTKRELVAYFVNSGYSHISSGMSYADTFEILMDSMVRYKIILQYSMVYFFEESKEEGSEYYGAYTIKGYENAVKDAKNDTERMELTLKYFLDNQTYDDIGYQKLEGGQYTRYDKAVYNLKKSINSAIDSQENNYIVSTPADDTATDEEETRTTPTGINATNPDFFDKDYQIYTGLLNTADKCGTYEEVEGSTLKTRKQAYNSFLSMLSSNYLLTKEELKIATTTGIEGVSYYKNELLTQLQSALSEKLSDAFESEAASGISSNYIKNKYDTILGEQKVAYDKDVTAYETALGSVSNSNFVLYTPQGADGDVTRYGFVYNILLPFSTQQNGELTELKNTKGLSKTELYKGREKILNAVEGFDRRADWFNGATDYSYKTDDTKYELGTTPTKKMYYGNSNYLFFEDSFTKAGDNAQYETMSSYYGKYAYNGTVQYNAEKDNYKLTPNKLTITNFLQEMENYMNFALAQKTYTNNQAGALSGEISYNNKKFNLKNGFNDSYMKNVVNNKGEIDYSSFVYYVGQVNGIQEGQSFNTLLVDNNASYTALSAFNELMFAYSTDTGCLNKTYGYSANRFKTEYVGEFEYAAKLAIAKGAGTYTVCPSDYGWHIIYCTYAFNQGEVYETINWDNFVENADSDIINEDSLPKNSFEYLFYQAVKSGLTSTYESTFQSKVTNLYNTDICVTIHEDRYSDYTTLENTMKSDDSTGAGVQG